MGLCEWRVTLPQIIDDIETKNKIRDDIEEYIHLFISYQLAVKNGGKINSTNLEALKTFFNLKCITYQQITYFTTILDIITRNRFWFSSESTSKYYIVRDEKNTHDKENWKQEVTSTTVDNNKNKKKNKKIINIDDNSDNEEYDEQKYEQYRMRQNKRKAKVNKTESSDSKETENEVDKEQKIRKDIKDESRFSEIRKWLISAFYIIVIYSKQRLYSKSTHLFKVVKAIRKYQDNIKINGDGMVYIKINDDYVCLSEAQENLSTEDMIIIYLHVINQFDGDLLLCLLKNYIHPNIISQLSLSRDDQKRYGDLGLDYQFKLSPDDVTKRETGRKDADTRMRDYNEIDNQPITSVVFDIDPFLNMLLEEKIKGKMKMKKKDKKKKVPSEVVGEVSSNVFIEDIVEDINNIFDNAMLFIGKVITLYTHLTRIDTSSA